MAQSMHELEVVPAHEHDIDQLMEVQFSAFENDPIHGFLYPGDHFSPTVRKDAGVRTIKAWREDPNIHFMKCVDQNTGRILGFAKWNFYLTERDYEEYSKRPVVDWTTGRQKEIMENFFNANAAMRVKVWGGKPHIVLGLLCVHRDWQRRGAGKALVQWGLDQAKAVALPAYLEASPDGFHLYRYLGFRQIETVIVKAEDWDGDVDQRLVVMVKDP